MPAPAWIKFTKYQKIQWPQEDLSLRASNILPNTLSYKVQQFRQILSTKLQLQYVTTEGD